MIYIIYLKYQLLCHCYYIIFVHFYNKKDPALLHDPYLLFKNTINTS